MDKDDDNRKAKKPRTLGASERIPETVLGDEQQHPDALAPAQPDTQTQSSQEDKKRTLSGMTATAIKHKSRGLTLSRTQTPWNKLRTWAGVILMRQEMGIASSGPSSKRTSSPRRSKMMMPRSSNSLRTSEFMLCNVSKPTGRTYNTTMPKPSKWRYWANHFLMQATANCARFL